MERLLGRFLEYVRVDTTAVEDTEEYPSSPGQIEVGRMLVEELRALGVEDAAADANGIVTATVPATVEGAPTIAWLAHLDTSPEASGSGVRPVVHKAYAGGDISLPGDPAKVIRVKDAPVLERLEGTTIVTSDGTTLLGADDKAGVAVIMTAVEELVSDPEIPHGPVRIVFTCDEEVGRGVDHLTPEMVGAVAAYTLDGEEEGCIESETFSADLATVTIRGWNIHPGLATGRMVNAVRIAGEFVNRMPWDTRAPETTSGRQGFLHPYILEAGVGAARIRILLRSFETPDLEEYAGLLREIAEDVSSRHPGCTIDVRVKEQYRNMADGLKVEPRAVSLAAEAMRQAGLEPVEKSTRGGTDGSRLTELGLPTPNLFAGMQNFHSELEFASLDQMEKAVRVLVELARLWGSERS